ncbi:MAG: hypothetical protein EOM10_00335 [Opitutae bacterium]|nr:hypothetical protein [Opitutae bacterium]
MKKENAHKVKGWLRSRAITQASIALELQVSRTTICRWIDGGVQSQRIYAHFINMGVPAKWFEGRPEARRAA